MHVFDKGQKYLKLVSKVLQELQSVLVPAVHVKHSVLHFEQILLSKSEINDPGGHEAVQVLSVE